MNAEGDRSRLQLLFGTDEAVQPFRTLRAGALTAELDGSSIRYVRWNGVEILRGIAFLLRDANWGTHSPVITDLTVVESGDKFSVSYLASLDAADGDFGFRATIDGSANGTLDYRATGISTRGFTTSRTGFVVLHPLQGVVGRPLEIRHVSGSTSRTTFPVLIDPASPASDIASLSYAPSAGAQLTVEFEGDAFEMEDHRNWTDASFKTYVRPLSRGYPYRIEPNTPITQAVRLRYRDAPGYSAPAVVTPTIRIGDERGRLPEVGLFADPKSLAADDLRPVSLRPGFLLGRLDIREPDPAHTLMALHKSAETLKCRLDLEVVIPGRDPRGELMPVGRALAKLPAPPASLVVFPARDLKGRPANSVPAGEASPEDILAAARAVAPDGTRVGGGMPCGFPELNRNRPPAGIDFITHATQATFHAADDVSVIETLEALEHVLRSARAFAGDVPYRLAPATIGLPEFWCSGRPAGNPFNSRVAMAEQDPRQRGLFAAAFAIGYLAQASSEGVDCVALAGMAGAFGATDENGHWYPLAAAIASVTPFARSPLLVVEAPAGLAAIAVGGDRPALWLANLQLAPRIVAAPDGTSFAWRWLMDAEALSGRAPDQIDAQPYAGAPFVLDAFAVCRLT